MLKIRQWRDRLMFNMEIPIAVRQYLYIETAPRNLLYFSALSSQCFALSLEQFFPQWSISSVPAYIPVILLLRDTSLAGESTNPLISICDLSWSKWHWLCVASWWILPIFFKVDSLALAQSYDCPSAYAYITLMILATTNFRRIGSLRCLSIYKSWGFH